MKRGMTIEFLKCRADLNFEVDFGVNGAIGTIVQIKYNKIINSNIKIHTASKHYIYYTITNQSNLGIRWS